MNVSWNPNGAKRAHITTAVRRPLSPTRHRLDQESELERSHQHALVTEHVSTAMPDNDADVVDAHGASACLLLRKTEHHLCAG